MIPNFIDIGASWKVLPPGIHEATLGDVEKRFTYNEKRKKLFLGILDAFNALRIAGCINIYLDGSYITEKPNPNDFDVCWDPMGVNDKYLDPVFFDFDNNRAKQKQKYGGEFFPSSSTADGTHNFVEFFTKDKETGLEKGIILII